MGMRGRRPIVALSLVTLVVVSTHPVRADDAPTTLPVDTGTPAPTTAPDAHASGVPEPTDPVLKVDDLSEVFKLSMRGGFLSLDTDLKARQESVRVKAPALAKDGEVRVDPTGDAPGAPLRMFRFTTPPDSDPNPTTKIDVSAISNMVQISHMTEVGDGTDNVELIQQVPLDAESDEPAVRLHINIADPKTGSIAYKQVLTADTFTELRQKYPREVSQYVVPILAMLQQDAALFTPDVELARHALRDESTPDVEMTKTVNDLIARLASDEPKARDDAYAALEKLGEPGALAASKVDRSKLSADQNSLLDQLLASRLPASPEDAKALASRPSFLVDCLYLDDADLRARAFERLQKVSNLQLTFDPNAPEPARRKQALAIRSQLTRWAASQPTERTY
jgi:hypothetical protein